MEYRQRTVRDNVSCTGIGLHTGQKAGLTIKPAAPGSGIKFIRKDLANHRAVKADYKNVINTHMSTSVGINGTKIATIEHLMAAFFGFGIDNARVEIDGPEVPIMDGSSAPFIFLLKSVGIREQNKPKQFIVIKKRFKVKEGNRSICVTPSSELKISYTVDFQHPLITNQRYDLTFSSKDFIGEISRARTFGFLKDSEIIRKAGLAKGVSLDNTIVMDDFRVLNGDGLRYSDEFVRHKILDFIGDLAIIGSPIIGHFEVYKSGHSLNQAMLKKLIDNERCWNKVPLERPEEDAVDHMRIPVFGPMEQVPV